ncbi:class I adenylate-forming enzyme family protein [Tomitella gaofuii]|uniref:class I adenylate-forming enzyme family protein n=1 Tax=Tomitella gaofuii TaxID=2760083 RepID=UPI0015FC7E11|nr:class I adenylate-forming enzyme family protein [Tomitella gaofuii]
MSALQAAAGGGGAAAPAGTARDNRPTGLPQAVSALVRRSAAQDPDAPAYITADRRTSRREYDRLADAVRWAVVAATGAGGTEDRGTEDRDEAGPAPVAVLLPDTAVIHAALVGCWRAGRIAAAIGVRTGDREAAHVIATAGARVLVTAPSVRGRGWRAIAAALAGQGAAPGAVVVVDEDAGTAAVHRGEGGQWTAAGQAAAAAEPAPATEPDPADVGRVSILNCTSGSTGLPKVVAHTEHTWLEFARMAALGGGITDADVVCSVVPAPYGFGLWSAHFLPALLGVPAVVTGRFDAAETAELIERERVTVLCCVTTQFKMLLRSPAARARDLSSLRVLYTGGEQVGRAAAEEFEALTGAKVLQFYGSNEAGPVSATTIRDDADTRLGTCGRLVAGVETRVHRPDSAGPRRGRLEVRSSLRSRGYWNDAAADRALFTDDGWMRMGDEVEFDEAGRLTVVGRTAQIIIRGGRNISVAEVEELVRAEPAVADVVVVPVPDPVFGERVCAMVVPAAGAAVDTASLGAALRARGVTPELLPEYVLCVDEMPMGAGGKADRGAARALAQAAAAAPPPSSGVPRRGGEVVSRGRTPRACPTRA